ncbi:hypothetical protein M569_17100, partial [Genlisea aurea]
MELTGRRGNYTLLSQVPVDPLYESSQSRFAGTSSPLQQQQQYYYHESQSVDRSRLKADRGASADWDLIDQRMISAQPLNRFVLQRQSSGSSFGESSISGDYFGTSDVGAVHLNDVSGAELRAKAAELSSDGGGGSSSSKSWAQQTEESYQLQLALTLRLSSDATCANDPNFLEPLVDDPSAASGFSEDLSLRFWVNGSMSYFDKPLNGFYSIHGMDPYVWAVCSDFQESGKIPSLESLKAVDPVIMPSVEVISVDNRVDPSLRELQNRICTLSSSSVDMEEVVQQLSNLVCNHMGGSASNGEDELFAIWKESSDDLKYCLGSIVLPIGSLCVGLCRHRSLLFKV